MSVILAEQQVVYQRFLRDQRIRSPFLAPCTDESTNDGGLADIHAFPACFKLACIPWLLAFTRVPVMVKVLWACWKVTMSGGAGGDRDDQMPCLSKQYMNLG